MINIEIDGKAVQVASGSTVMDAANQVGAYIPHFCYHKKLSIAANCRMCLVQVEKAPKPMPACATPVTEGMKVFTASDYAKKAQQSVMEFLLINHPLDCPICDQGGECQLQDLAVGYGNSGSRYQEEKRVVFVKNIGPLISAAEMSRCIQCTRCVRFGQEVAGIMELGMGGRGEAAHYRKCLQMAWDSASWREWFYALCNLPRTLAHLRRPGPAAQLMGFAEAFYAQRFGQLGAEDLPEARRTRRLAAAQLGREATAGLWRQGATMAMAEAMKLALEATPSDHASASAGAGARD